MERWTGQEAWEMYAFYQENRKRPLFYNLPRNDAHVSRLIVPGHYETPTGGTDTLKTVDQTYELVRSGAAGGNHVLFEGIMAGDDVTRTTQLAREFPFSVIALDTPIEECLAGIRARREAKGNEKELDPKNTVSRADRLRRSMVPRLKDNGVNVKWLKREEAFAEVCRLLGI
jgi:hypothetical protein